MAPDTKLTYPIPHDDKGGSVFVYGDKACSHLIIMCPGWPDDHSAVERMARRLAESGNCLVGVACLPGFDDRRPEKPWQSHWKDGYSFDEWVVCLREAIKALRAHSTADKAKLTGIFHDWGCFVGFQYTNHEIARAGKEPDEMVPDQLVLMDVLLGPHPKTPDKPRPKVPMLARVYKGVAMVSYQLTLAISWFLHRYVSRYLAVVYLTIASGFLWLFRLSPGNYDDFCYLAENSRGPLRTLYMCYPYYRMWKAVITGVPARRIFRFAFLPLDLERTPILYLYGTAKPFQLHSPNSLALLERESQQGHRSRVVPIEGGGHWFHWKKPDVAFEHVNKFVLELK